MVLRDTSGLAPVTTAMAACLDLEMELLMTRPFASDAAIKPKAQSLIVFSFTIGVEPVHKATPAIL